ncbi:myb/SANT-like DNA-binding domain-containing protein 1 [Chanos chanos]|uniref:Myb/SANT-like DNA-binding domain-containing protein 1 n=1 Tax=Chanos chanos TaxID=29144 RepID=A0A6J2VPV7_CHACN|nr:myb/SANT-like DNA-binding domain-containing protein 1 [Chanos chanos]
MAAEDSFSYIVQNEKHRRARNWTDAEMKGLVYVWEEYVTDLKKAKRNAKIYERMAKRFSELTGEHRHKEEIKMKITNMTFQYSKLKNSVNGSAGSPDWPYYKAIERILSKVPEQSRASLLDLQASGPSTSLTECPMSGHDTSPAGFLPEYTGSSDERDLKEEDQDGTESSISFHSLESRSQPVKRKRMAGSLSLRRRKVRVMEAMLQEQKKVSRAIEETCREVRRAMHQQNFLQVQCLQLQERMMNLLEKMISPPAPKPNTWSHAGLKEPSQGQT